MEPNMVEALVCLTFGGPFERRLVKMGEMREDEIIVRMVATGVCFTDLAATRGAFPIAMPLIAGHEGAGIVERIGSGVIHVKVGDHVLLTFNVCGRCQSCRNGHPAYCADSFQLNLSGSRMDGSSTFSLNGEKISSPFFGQSSFSQRAIVSGRSAVKVDETLPLDILCSLGCGLQTGAGTVLNVLKPSVGSTLVIFGVGAVGMAGIMAARLTPVSNIVAVDIVDTKLKLAVELGATYTINAKDRDVSQDIKALNGGKGFNFAFDTTGNLKIIQTMIDSAPPMSVIASVGASLPGETVRIEPATWVTRGVTYTGAHQGSSVPQEFIPSLIEFWKSGRFPIEKIVKTYPYADIEEARKDLEQGACLKAVLLW